jgi:single-strand DNA-binding protein
MYLNKATIIGNLTRDPELKALPSGMQVASFSVATNRTWKDKDGAKQESADFHNIVVFGKQAENVTKYLTKGSQILIEGRLQTRSWDKDGQKIYRTEIVADRVQFGSKSVKPASNTSDPTTKGEVEYPEEEINPDDIPF